MYVTVNRAKKINNKYITINIWYYKIFFHKNRGKDHMSSWSRKKLTYMVELLVINYKSIYKYRKKIFIFLIQKNAVYMWNIFTIWNDELLEIQLSLVPIKCFKKNFLVKH